MHLKSGDCSELAAASEMSLTQLQALWEEAAGIDATLAVRAKLLPKLLAKRTRPEHFSRSLLFQHISNSEASLLAGFPIGKSEGTGSRATAPVLDLIRYGFPRAKRARVRVARSVQYLSIPEVINRWRREESVFGVTDLHYIGTRFDRNLNTAALNAFNLLPRGTDGFQSQDSLVISSARAFTDSHSDDHSGSNHCFEGLKLWLMWDTVEGLQQGLEDAERCKVNMQASFDMPAFLSMCSSRWLLVGPGQTIFIPGYLTHKVITLRRYLGLGSFYAALPNFIDTLVRWADLPPVWARKPKGNDNRCCVAFIARRAIRKLRALKHATNRERRIWGVPFLQTRLHQLRFGEPSLSSLSEKTPILKAFIRVTEDL